MVAVRTHACVILLGCAPLTLGADARALTSDSESAATCDGGASARDIQAIGADPNLLFKDAMSGGERLAWRVRGLATSGPRGLQAIARGISLANSAQKTSIGRGLAKAAVACDQRAGIVATEIADLIRDVGDGAVTEAFTNYLTNATDSDKPDVRRREAVVGARVPLSGAPSDAARYFDGPIDRDIWRLDR